VQYSDNYNIHVRFSRALPVTKVVSGFGVNPHFFDRVVRHDQGLGSADTSSHVRVVGFQPGLSRRYDGSGIGDYISSHTSRLAPVRATLSRPHKAGCGLAGARISFRDKTLQGKFYTKSVYYCGPHYLRTLKFRAPCLNTVAQTNYNATLICNVIKIMWVTPYCTF
jgi:hypothetical protein